MIEHMVARWPYVVLWLATKNMEMIFFIHQHATYPTDTTFFFWPWSFRSIKYIYVSVITLSGQGVEILGWTILPFDDKYMCKCVLMSVNKLLFLNVFSHENSKPNTLKIFFKVKSLTIEKLSKMFAP